MQGRDLGWREAHLTTKVPWMSPRPGEDEARSEVYLFPTPFFVSYIQRQPYSHIHTHPSNLLSELLNETRTSG